MIWAHNVGGNRDGVGGRPMRRTEESHVESGQQDHLRREDNGDLPPEMGPGRRHFRLFRARFVLRSLRLNGERERRTATAVARSCPGETLIGWQVLFPGMNKHPLPTDLVNTNILRAYLHLHYS
jgi:hypothetical protein